MIIYLQILETQDDQSKFEQIYLEYRNLMFYVAYGILRNEESAEDATHQAFVRIAENIKKIGEPVCPKTHGYVVTIVEHEAIDQYRKAKKRQAIPFTDDIHGVEVAYDGDDTLTSCILGLPARYREMILLRYHQGYRIIDNASRHHAGRRCSFISIFIKHRDLAILPTTPLEKRNLHGSKPSEHQPYRPYNAAGYRLRKYRHLRLLRRTHQAVCGAGRRPVLLYGQRHCGKACVFQHRCEPARPPAGLCVQPVLIRQRFPVDKSKVGKHNRPVSENNVAARQ